MISVLILLGVTFIIPTYFTKRKWESEKENGVFGYTIWEFARMWFWIWLASSACLSGIASLFI
jgi:hypothetical protein